MGDEPNFSKNTPTYQVTSITYNPILTNNIYPCFFLPDLGLNPHAFKLFPSETLSVSIYGACTNRCVTQRSRSFLTLTPSALCNVVPNKRRRPWPPTSPRPSILVAIFNLLAIVFSPSGRLGEKHALGYTWIHLAILESIVISFSAGFVESGSDFLLRLS